MILCIAFVLFAHNRRREQIPIKPALAGAAPGVGSRKIRKANTTLRSFLMQKGVQLIIKSTLSLCRLQFLLKLSSYSKWNSLQFQPN